MRIEFGKRCSMMKEAMSLLEFAVNVVETERRRYLSKLGRFGEEKEPGILLQKELLELSGQIPVTEPMRPILNVIRKTVWDVSPGTCSVPSMRRRRTTRRR